MLMAGDLFLAGSVRAEVDIFQIIPASAADAPVSVKVTTNGVLGEQSFTVFYKTNVTTADPFIHAQLEIAGTHQPVTSVPVEKDWKPGGVEFEFSLAGGYLKTSKFTVTEQGHVRDQGMPGFVNWWFCPQDFAVHTTAANKP